MRKKIFTILLALAASIGMMWAETVVVINKSEFTSSGVTKEGVTLALSSGSMTSSDPLAMSGSFEFSTSLGKFTGITIETDINIMEIYEGAYTSAGWPTGDNLGTSAVWTGESETVLISCMVAGMDITITCTIEPAQAAGIPCTAEDLGKVLCTDGSIYATVSEATAASKTAVAMIAYVDTENGKALALALADESGTMDWETAKTTAVAHTPAVSGGTWTLASKDDWNNMITAAGDYTALRDGFSAVGGTNMQQAAYWSSTPENANAWRYYFTYGGMWTDGYVDNPCRVRACLAFDIPAGGGSEPEGDGKLTGAFTINANGDKIVFSNGNLQYQASTTTWRFATNQYDMIGEDNANISDTYTGWIDLFGWGTGNNPTNTSEQDEDYSTFTDWGVNAISNGGNEANLWRTLTRYEWAYLIQTRTNAAALKGQATVADVHGFVLLPDSWTLPAGLSFTASPNNWTTNVYTAEQWAQMEAAGAVFLPATGYRNPDIIYVGEKGWYWSSDVLSANAAYDFEFTETNSRVFGSRHYFGQPVRLVTAYDAPAPQPAEDVDITPNVDPENPTVYYSTFFDSSVKYELPAGVEAYVADLSGANLLLTKIAEAGEVIPANVAVILKSTVTPFTLTVSDADAVTFTATNDLQGSDTQIATPDNCYVLAGTDGVVGFYHYTAANLNAHKAYVVYSGSNQAPRRMPFVFDQATGVENIQGDNVQSTKVIENGVLYIIKNGVKYNAQGQIVK